MISNIHAGIGKVIRSSGQMLDSIGKNFEVHPYTERRKYFFPSAWRESSLSSIIFPFLAVQPSTQVVKLGKNIPKINGAFIAPSATVAGKVEIAKGASVWYGAVLRGESCEL
jgi:hypothetical protein